jgi:hypothetical protein
LFVYENEGFPNDDWVLFIIFAGLNYLIDMPKKKKAEIVEVVAKCDKPEINMKSQIVTSNGWLIQFVRISYKFKTPTTVSSALMTRFITSAHR